MRLRVILEYYFKKIYTNIYIGETSLPVEWGARDRGAPRKSGKPDIPWTLKSRGPNGRPWAKRLEEGAHGVRGA